MEIEKRKFYHHKGPILLEDVDIQKVSVTNKISFVEQNISTLLVTCTKINTMFSKTSTCVKSYDGKTKRMYFWDKDDSLLEKYNNVWDDTSADIKEMIW